MHVEALSLLVEAGAEGFHAGRQGIQAVRALLLGLEHGADGFGEVFGGERGGCHLSSHRGSEEISLFPVRPC
jgi:hypothetical protein